MPYRLATPHYTTVSNIDKFLGQIGSMPTINSHSINVSGLLKKEANFYSGINSYVNVFLCVSQGF